LSGVAPEGQTFRHREDLLWRWTPCGVLAVSDDRPDPVLLTGLDELVFRLLARLHSPQEIHAVLSGHQRAEGEAEVGAALARLVDGQLASPGSHE
jgi:hypothetical protein